VEWVRKRARPATRPAIARLLPSSTVCETLLK
jgi:hypothetical protein